MFIPVMLGMVYRKTPWWSGITAVSIGITATLIMNVVATVMAGHPFDRIAHIFTDVQFSLFGIEYGKFELNIFFGVMVSTAVFFITSWWPNKKEQDIARLAALDKDLRTPAYADDAPIDKKSIQSYKIVALLSGLIGVLLILLSMFSGNSQDFLINFLAGFGALLFSYLFWFLSKRYV